MSVRALAERVRRLEQLRARPSPIEVMYGSIDAFEAEMQRGIDAGRFDRGDMPHVLAAIRRWHDDGAWQAWVKLGQIWRQG
jgi:hypothetical protein